jgi:hypothetical protein
VHASHTVGPCFPYDQSNTMKPIPISPFRRALLLLLLAGLSACHRATDPLNLQVASSAPASDQISVAIDSVNYQHKMGLRYTLYTMMSGRRTAIGGDIADPLASGGAKNCCLNLPVSWHPGLKVWVEWQESDYERTYPDKFSKELEIPRYAKPADLYLVFYPDHDVEAVVSPAEPGHPDWAGRIKRSPWDECIGEFGLKVCKAAIPKPGLSINEMRGFCDSKTLKPGQCERLLESCVEDYEDREMCTKLVWEKKK